MDIPEKYLPTSGAGRKELKTIYSWSIEDAAKSHEDWGKAQHAPADRGPFFKWTAAQKLRELADNFIQTNDKSIILEAMFICAMDELPIPRWCNMAFIKSYRDVWFRAVTSWDEAFGKPHPKGTHALDYRTERNNAFKVYQRIQEISKKGSHIDGNLFSEVGLEMGIGGKTKTAELYYEAKRWHDSLKDMEKRRIEEMEKHYSKINSQDTL